MTRYMTTGGFTDQASKLSTEQTKTTRTQELPNFTGQHKINTLGVEVPTKKS